MPEAAKEKETHAKAADIGAAFPEVLRHIGPIDIKPGAKGVFRRTQEFSFGLGPGFCPKSEHPQKQEEFWVLLLI